MTKEEIKAIIKAKIEGQGTAIDAGSVMPIILNGIIDLSSDSDDRMSITAISGATLTAAVNHYYVGSNVGTLAITLPTITGAQYVETIAFALATGSSPAVTFTGAGSETILYEDGFELAASSNYEITALWNGSYWTITAVLFVSGS